ncbi:MAG: threonine synthase [Gammaproteobacteria bacterium]|nr:threonine synthase [Gammaproteobacteria bacterium]NIM74933.1 threonine synthase [Gammaproteobacteria bacterium]NIN39722.1 threonine synthase [Gammaproteobacteria bacterium]NIO26850.1 threonine synthase [Gammaproteobacteria bacterium]NIO67406.1 threonine synthase [Gammaproteobacteria bacterium]
MPDAPRAYRGLLDRYRRRLPVSDSTPIVNLYEGNTPLLHLENIPRDAGIDAEIWVKFEGLNPTGSFKDRGMTMAVSRALEEGSRAIICASTGNTSASAAAYAARAGMQAFVLIPDGKIAVGKLAQAMMHGATVIKIGGNFDDGMRLVRETAEEAPVTIVNSINPYRLQGQKTVAFEVVEALGRAPDYHCLPVGNAGNISAHWIGYSECCPEERNCITEACNFCGGDCPYAGTPLADSRPVMVGYQARGAAPFVEGHPVEKPDTVATAIRIGNPQSWDLALATARESGGWFDAFDDDAILATQKLLAEREGIFCEPASAVAVSGAIKDLKSGRIAAGSTVVCTLTGHGLKDSDIAIAQSSAPVITVRAERNAVRDAIMGALA